MDSSIWAQRYPGLFESSYVDYANTQLSFTLEPDEIDAIGRLHLIALTADDHVLVCASADGWRFLPGGTREPGENLLQLAARELMEEAGAELGGELDLFGAHVAISGNPGRTARTYRTRDRCGRTRSVLPRSSPRRRRRPVAR